jgi:hypothetical protein
MRSTPGECLRATVRHHEVTLHGTRPIVVVGGREDSGYCLVEVEHIGTVRNDTADARAPERRVKKTDQVKGNYGFRARQFVFAGEPKRLEGGGDRLQDDSLVVELLVIDVRRAREVRIYDPSKPRVRHIVPDKSHHIFRSFLHFRLPSSATADAACKVLGIGA